MIYLVFRLTIFLLIFSISSSSLSPGTLTSIPPARSSRSSVDTRESRSPQPQFGAVNISWNVRLAMARGTSNSRPKEVARATSLKAKPQSEMGRIKFAYEDDIWHDYIKHYPLSGASLSQNTPHFLEKRFEMLGWTLIPFSLVFKGTLAQNEIELGFHNSL